MDVMIDTETLGKRPGCILLSIAAVPFELEGDGTHPDHFHVIVDPVSCEDVGLRAEVETVMWWLKSGAKPPEMEHAISVQVALHALELFLARHEAQWVWVHGADFDPGILQMAFHRALKHSTPWEKRVQDTRTLYRLAGWTPKKAENAHDALADALCQVREVQGAYKKLREAPKTYQATSMQVLAEFDGAPARREVNPDNGHGAADGFGGSDYCGEF